MVSLGIGKNSWQLRKETKGKKNPTPGGEAGLYTGCKTIANERTGEQRHPHA